ncbi:MAG: DUF58 domain-containing protein [Thaumarchaeota archaeon]|nr:DUF58 domain-containing protein [Nitrososphaerota archaeon]
MAAFSFLFFWTRFRRADVSVRPNRVRVFKRESGAVSIEVGRGGSRWVTLTSVALKTQPGLASEISHLPSGDLELVLKPSLAGRLEGLEATLNATDVLGLFTKQRTFRLELILEALPLALRERPPQLVVPLLAFGEDPAGVNGSGQEFYGVSEYQPGLDPRDIMWMRAAGRTDEVIPVRIREANVRRAVSIVVQVGSNTDEEKAVRGDLVAEALGKIGMQLLAVGSVLEIMCPPPWAVQTVTVSDARELADATGLPWVAVRRGPWMKSPSDRIFDLLIIGPFESSTPSLATIPRSRQLLILSDGPAPQHLPWGAALFTGGEDLSEVATSVIAG